MNTVRILTENDVAQVVKNSPAMQGDLGLLTGLGRSPGGRHDNDSSFLPGESPWTVEPSRPQSMESQRVRHN